MVINSLVRYRIDKKDYEKGKRYCKITGLSFSDLSRMGFYYVLRIIEEIEYNGTIAFKKDFSEFFRDYSNGYGGYFWKFEDIIKKLPEESKKEMFNFIVQKSKELNVKNNVKGGIKDE